MEHIIDYINDSIALELEKKTGEKKVIYFITPDNENNKLIIKPMSPSGEYTLFKILFSNKNVLEIFTENVLGIIRNVDSYVVKIIIHIIKTNNTINSMIIEKVRDFSLINLLDCLVEDMINQILIFSDVKTIKNFTTTCKKYYKIINNDDFWSMKIRTDINISIINIKDLTYKEFYKYYYKYKFRLLLLNSTLIIKEDICNISENYGQLEYDPLVSSTDYNKGTLTNYFKICIR